MANLNQQFRSRNINDRLRQLQAEQAQRQQVQNYNDQVNEVAVIEGVRVTHPELLNTLIQRRVAGEPLGYGILELTPQEQELFEKISKEARASGYSQRAENISKFQQRLAQSGQGVASTATGVLESTPAAYTSTGAAYSPVQYSYKESQVNNIQDVIKSRSNANEVFFKANNQLVSREVQAPRQNVKVVTIPKTFNEELAAEKSNLGKLRVIESRVSNKLSSYLINSGIISKDSFLASQNPYVNKFSPRGSDILFGSFFAPAFATGTSGQVQTFEESAVEQLSPLRKKKKAKDIADAIKEVFLREDPEAELAQKEVINNFKELVKLNIEDKNKLTQVKKFIEESLGKERGKVVFKDLVEQQRAILPEPIKIKVAPEILGNVPQQKGASVVTSSLGKYAGTGKYERTNEVGVMIPKNKQTTSTQFENLSNKQLESQSQKYNVLQLSNQREKVLSILKTPSKQQNKQPQETTQRFRQEQSLFFRQPQDQNQRQNQRQQQEQAARQRQGNPRSPRLRPPGTAFPPITSGGSSRGRNIDDTMLGKAYDVFVRRKGREIKIAEDLPIGRARKAGVSANLGTLAASFTLKESGLTSKEDIVFEVPKNIFYPSKRRANTYVQKRGTRLSARSEVTEIIGFKKRKGKTRFL